MSNTKFDLERFKAGEEAIDEHGDGNNYYMGELPDGQIVVRFLGVNGNWDVISDDPKNLSIWTMKPKEEWTWISETCIYQTREQVEEKIRRNGWKSVEPVRIVRD